MGNNSGHRVSDRNKGKPKIQAAPLASRRMPWQGKPQRKRFLGGPEPLATQQHEAHS